MRILLTGATGYIGSAVAEALQIAGHQVIGLARTDKAVQHLKSWDVDALRGDLKSPQTLGPALDHVDAVVHTAATKDVEMADIDRQAVEIILSALAGTGKAFLYTSGTWILGNVSTTNTATVDKPHSINPIPLMAWRADVETAVLSAQTQQVRGIVIRPGIVYGRGGGLVAQLVATGKTDGVVTFVGAGENRWALVHVEDLARCYVLALERSPAGMVFDVAGECSLSFRDIAQGASQAAGIPGCIQAQSLKVAREQLGLLVDGLVLDQQFGQLVAEQVLGWQPLAPSVLDELKHGSYTTGLRLPTVEDVEFVD